MVHECFHRFLFNFGFSFLCAEICGREIMDGSWNETWMVFYVLFVFKPEHRMRLGATYEMCISVVEGSAHGIAFWPCGRGIVTTIECIFSCSWWHVVRVK